MYRVEQRLLPVLAVVTVRQILQDSEEASEHKRQCQEYHADNPLRKLFHRQRASAALADLTST